MSDLSSYPGEELVLFEKAVKWKKYFHFFIKPYIKKEVAEIGAGLGTNTPLLNDGSANLWTLVEPDAGMAEVLENKIADHQLPANCKAVRGTLAESLQRSPHLDTIIYIDVLEHIEHDSKELEMAALLLRPGGHLIILSPAFQSLYSPFDKAIGHYRRYTKSTLQKVIPASLTKVQLRYLDTMGFFMSAMNRLLLRQNYPTQKQVQAWDSYGIPISRITDPIAFYSFGKTILGIWKK